MRYIARLITPTLLLGSPLTLLAHEGSDHYGPHMMWQGYGMMMGPLVMILFIAIIIAVGVLVFRWLSGQNIGSRTSADHESISILKSRFARGEIDKEEFEERLRLLQDQKTSI